MAATVPAGEDVIAGRRCAKLVVLEGAALLGVAALLLQVGADATASLAEEEGDVDHDRPGPLGV